MPVTKRDRIWHAALELRAELESGENDDKFKNHNWGHRLSAISTKDVMAEVPNEVGDRTVRDCLNAMAELGELNKVESNPTVYRSPR